MKQRGRVALDAVSAVIAVCVSTLTGIAPPRKTEGFVFYGIKTFTLRSSMFCHNSATKKTGSSRNTFIIFAHICRCAPEPVWVFPLTSVYHGGDVDQLHSCAAVAVPRSG